jgi:hypothetical protein
MKSTESNTVKTSKYVGVCLDKTVAPHARKWFSHIRGIRIGSFYTEEEAALTYDVRALEIYGENAKLNFPNLIRISATVVEVKYPGNDLPTCMYVLQDFGEVGLRVPIHMMGTL